MSTYTREQTQTLFTETNLGSVTVANRVAVAPMTRVSATEDGRPTDRIAAYYRVYAEGGFGLLITEGLYPDLLASQGYLFQPGLATPEQAEAWRPVVEAVHAAGAKIFAQLMHAGSQAQGNSHQSSSWGPSAVRPKGQQLAFYRGGGQFDVPEAMTLEQIDQVRNGFVTAARLARDAGFDGVEIHGANGYLLDQFLTDYLNTRTDRYGGSTENRIRLAAEISRDVADAVGSDIATGIRISQGKVSDPDHKWAGAEQDAAVIFGLLGQTGIDFIHTTEYRALAPAFGADGQTLAELAKKHSRLPVIVNGGLDNPRDAATLIGSGVADVIALGKPALANRDWPQLVARGETPADEVPASVFSPLATVKDWELVPAGAETQ